MKSLLKLLQLTPDALALLDEKTQEWGFLLYRAVRRMLMSAILVTVIAYLLNITGYHYVNLGLFLLVIYAISLIAIMPEWWIRIFGVGVAIGVPDPSRNFWQGGTHFLELYKDAILYFMSSIAIILFLLSMVSFEGNAIVPIILLAMTIVLMLISARLGWTPYLALVFLFISFLVLGSTPVIDMAMEKFTGRSLSQKLDSKKEEWSWSKWESIDATPALGGTTTFILDSEKKYEFRISGTIRVRNYDGSSMGFATVNGNGDFVRASILADYPNSNGPTFVTNSEHAHSSAIRVGDKIVYAKKLNHTTFEVDERTYAHLQINCIQSECGKIKGELTVQMRSQKK